MATDCQTEETAIPGAATRRRHRLGWRRFLALGDSYTVGEGVRPEQAWPARLTLRLRVDGVPVADPQVIARTGFTCDELLGALRASLRERSVAAPYDMVALLVGVNDQYRGNRPRHWQSTYVTLLEEALRLADDRAGDLVVVSVPDWGVTPFAQGRDRAEIASEIDELNRIQRGLALATGAQWVEITDLGREGASDPLSVTDDGLHPSARMYERWLERLLPAALRTSLVAVGA